MDGAYNGAKLNCINQAVISDNGVDKNTGYSVPLEIMPSGQFEPLYKTTLSVQVCLLFHFIEKWSAGITGVYHTVLICFLSVGRMENCRFFRYLFMGHLLWLIAKPRRSIHPLISFSSISMINEV